MKDQLKTKKELLEENAFLRQKIHELKHVELEQKRAENMLRESEERFQLVSKAANDAIYDWNLESGTAWLSEAHHHLFGVSTDNADFTWWSSHIHPEDRDRVISSMHVAMEKGVDVWWDEYRFRCADGHYVDILDRGHICRDIKGTPIRLVGSMMDITERKRAEEALIRSEQLLKETQTISKVGGWEYDVEKKLITWTDEVYRIYGVEKNYDPNDIEKSISFYHEDDKQIIEKAFLNAVNTGKPYDLELQFNAADGTPKWVRTMGDSVLKDGKIIKVYGNIIDITERKRMEEELLKADKLESVGLLAGGIAHDFNNILTSISGNISMAKMQVEPGHKIFDLLNAAEKALVRAQGLTRQLLTFAKGGAPVKETASISKLIKESSPVILRGSKSVCEFQIPEDLWSVEADVGQISQAIRNIVINANQAMPEGGIIRIMAENLMPEKINEIPVEPGRYIRISIKDQGVGIAEQNLSKIFDPYFTTKQAGSGLGLATAYSIIQKHSGHISVDSRLGAGTTFHIYLPASEKKVSVKDEAVLLKGCGKILVMDDDKTLKEMLYDMLEMLCYESSFARDGDEAIEMYRKGMESEKPFDAVILDLTIPGSMGGEEVIKILLEIDPKVKAIVCSGYSDSEVMSNYRKYGFKGMMPKPFDSYKLGRVLNDVLEDSKTIKET